MHLSLFGTFLRERNISPTDAAAALRTIPACIRSWARGATVPPLGTMADIAVYSAGAVPAESWSAYYRRETRLRDAARFARVSLDLIGATDLSPEARLTLMVLADDCTGGEVSDHVILAIGLAKSRVLSALMELAAADYVLFGPSGRGGWMYSLTDRGRALVWPERPAPLPRGHRRGRV